MRTFEIFYPESGNFDRITVDVLPGETPERAIIREGDAVEGWVLSQEVFPDEPTWTKRCDCGGIVSRYPGEGDVTCSHGRCEYNAGGQRLRDDWRGNRSWYDEDVSDLEGYEQQHAGD